MAGDNKVTPEKCNTYIKPTTMNAIELLTLHIKTFVPRLVISHSINAWKSQAVWSRKYLDKQKRESIHIYVMFIVT